MPISNPTDLTGYALSASGTYTGNGAANRALPHGLGVVPKFVVCICSSAAGNRKWAIQVRPGYMHYPETPYFTTVTAMNATNFYVGNAADYDLSVNANTGTYYWAAFA